MKLGFFKKFLIFLFAALFFIFAASAAKAQSCSSVQVSFQVCTCEQEGPFKCKGNCDNKTDTCNNDGFGGCESCQKNGEIFGQECINGQCVQQVNNGNCGPYPCTVNVGGDTGCHCGSQECNPDIPDCDCTFNGCKRESNGANCSVKTCGGGHPSCNTSAPTNLVFTQVSNNTWNLSWAPGSNGTSQHVYVGTNENIVSSHCPSNDTTCVINAQINDNTTSNYAITGLSAGTVYYFIVQTYKSSSCSSDSAVLTDVSSCILNPSTLTLPAGASTGLVTSVGDLGTGNYVLYSTDGVTNPSKNPIFTINPTQDNTYIYGTNVTGVRLGTSTVTGYVEVGGAPICSSSSTVTVVSPNPWWQVKDGDVTTNGDLLTNVSSYTGLFELPGDGGYPGVPMYGGSTDLTTMDVSETGWLANSSYASSRLYNSTYFLNAVPSDVTVNKLTGTFDQTALDGGVTDPDGYTWFMYDATSTNLPLNIGADIDLGTKKVILMVKGGDINLSGNINLTDGHGFFLGVASGNINVASSVTTLEGVYVTDGNFNTGTNNTNPGTDAELVVRGTVAAYGGMNLQRNLTDNTGPSELFEYAPDQELLFPAKLSYYPSAWREVAP